jgi:DNA-binding transcriptional regulator GbsR (MarR family)
MARKRASDTAVASATDPSSNGGVPRQRLDSAAGSADAAATAREPVAPDPAGNVPMSAERLEFAEQFGLFWHEQGSKRMEGRILGYLLISSEPYVSAAQLAADLQSSAGAISVATRLLSDVGFIHRHAVPGDRAHYWAVDDDVWGSFLAGERPYLERQRKMAEGALAIVPIEDEGPRRRLAHMRDYMTWLKSHHAAMRAEWAEYKATHEDL